MEVSEDSDNGLTEDPQHNEQAEVMDPECYHTIKNKLIRIQYPAIVKNLDKAFATLGGLTGIQRAVSIAPNKLTLNFHPENKYNKGVTADCNSHAGILLKVKKHKSANGQSRLTYEIVGGTVKNFVFKKLIDFQYLPLVANFPEKKESEVNYIYESIFPKELPSLESVLKEDKAKMTLFLPPMGFSRTDVQRKLNPIEKHTTISTNEKNEGAKKKVKKNIPASKLEHVHKYTDSEVPMGPSESYANIIQVKHYQAYLKKLEDLFSERPIWTKNGLKYNCNLSNDLYRILLPAVAYYQTTGPWRITWTRFGYDPRKDPESRKYQILDYRIPQAIRSNLKIGSKRCHMTKVNFTNLEDVVSEDENDKKISENSFILRPNMLPCSRQMFYQYCDLLLPEIQAMLARLPPVSPNSKCDSKNGWFPSSFIDQCREIVNKYVDQKASKVLDEVKSDNSTKEKFSSDTKSTGLMLKNIKRGLYTDSKPSTSKFEEPSTELSTSFDYSETESITEIMDTDSDDSDQEIFQSENEIQFENTDGDMIISADQESLDIDMEVLEDVRSILAKTEPKNDS